MNKKLRGIYYKYIPKYMVKLLSPPHSKLTNMFFIDIFILRMHKKTYHVYMYIDRVYCQENFSISHNMGN